MSVVRQVCARSTLRLALWGAVAALCLPLAACGPAHRASAPPLRWMIEASAVQKLLNVPGAAPAVRAALDTPNTVVMGSPPSAIRSWSVRWARSATSLSGVTADLRAASADRLSAVVYDQEHWSFTPTAEQTDPASYVRQAEAIAKRQHVQLIATPATDLVWAVGRPAPGTAYSTFLRLGIAGSIAPYADVLEIQAQGAEADVAQYGSFVRAVAAQARAANPTVVLYAGLSTNPTGHHVTATELEADVAATRAVVSGYWLNVPGASAYCPTCGTAQPQVGAALLESLYPSAAPASMAE